MRLNIQLSLIRGKTQTPNYYYPLSSAIYKLLQFSSPKFAEFLHDIGFKLNKKRYKLFTFALIFERIKFVDSQILMQSPNAKLIISSPLVEEFIHNFVLSTLSQEIIELNYEGCQTKFQINSVEVLEQPEFKNEMFFRLLSPLVISTKKEINGKLLPYYLTPEDDLNEINRILTGNLKNKYELINKKEFGGNGLNLEWVKDYIARRKKRNKHLTKMLTVKKHNFPPVHIRGIEVPFRLKGDVGLIRTGYETGFGSNNSLGCGLADVSRDDIPAKK